MLDCAGLMVADENYRTARKVYLEHRAANPCEWREGSEPDTHFWGTPECNLKDESEACQTCRQRRELYRFQLGCRREVARHMRVLRKQFKSAKWRLV